MRSVSLQAVAVFCVLALACAAEEKPADHAFLARASATVKQYTELFRDLSAEDAEKIEMFDASGKVSKTRQVASTLVIYQANDHSGASAEYRDIHHVDGQEVAGHEQRVLKLFEAVQNENAAAFELQRINDESQRFDLSHRVTGFTLSQALPLRNACHDSFGFTEEGDEHQGEREARVFSYQQTGKCLAAGYRLPLPPELKLLVLQHRGKLWLDAANARVLREDREVYVTRPDGSQVTLLKFQFLYQPSSFGLNVPSASVLEIYGHPQRTKGQPLAMSLSSRVSHEYSGFSRFSVSTKSKTSATQAQP